MKKKAVKLLSILLAAALLIGASVGGTLAYLSAKSEAVTNTFAVGEIKIELTETKDTEDYKIVPGASQVKKPEVTIKSGSEKCYVYVSIVNDLVLEGTTVATLDIGTNWTAIGKKGNETVYRYTSVVDAASEDSKCVVFENVTYATTITETDMTKLNEKTIVVEAYAHQSENASQDVADKAARDCFGVDAISG